MDDRLTSILRRYSHGEISAERAADEMGATYNVADVYVLSREAGLPLPDSKSAWGPGADRHHNILIYFASEGSIHTLRIFLFPRHPRCACRAIFRMEGC
jgi:hypothetical protein